MSEEREMSSETDSAWDGTTIIPQGPFYSPLDSWVRQLGQGGAEGSQRTQNDQLYSFT